MKFQKCNVRLLNPEEQIVNELTTKVAEAIEARGIEVTALMGKLGDSTDYGVYEYQIRKGSKEIIIETVYRSNGTEKNTSARIELIEWNEHRVGKYLERLKITKGSGDRAINNKINKVLEKF